MTMQEEFEKIHRPSWEIERVHLNLRETKALNFVGECKLYFGNIAFECNENDIYKVFKQVGSVGDVLLVQEDEGKVQGFGFVTMHTMVKGEKSYYQIRWIGN